MLNTFYRHHQSALLLLLLWAGSSACQDSPPAEAGNSPSTGTPVEVTHPHRADMTEYIDLNANTVYLKKEIVRATFPGFIENIDKNIGDDVKSGEVLLRIKTKESAADDSLQLTLGSETFRGFVSLRARSDGVLTALNYHSGDFIAEGEEIAIISNPSSLRISLNVPYQYVAKIRRDERCRIFLPDGRVLGAVIQKVIPSVEPVSQTQTFLLKIADGAGLPENLNLNARLPLRSEKNALVVPRTAVMSNETLDQFWVMKLLDDSTALRVDITKGLENDSLVQVSNPMLELGDRIVSVGAFGLPDTATIAISEPRP